MPDSVAYLNLFVSWGGGSRPIHDVRGPAPRGERVLRPIIERDQRTRVDGPGGMRAGTARARRVIMFRFSPATPSQ